MATGGLRKDYEGQKYNIRRFAYDVLYFTLSKCGFPKTHLRIKVDKENEYSHPDFVKTIHSAVLSIAFYMRDKWKRMFEDKQKSKELNDMQKVEKYLVKIDVLPEFWQTDVLDKIERSLAFYSELILFLHSNNIEVDFGKLLDTWLLFFQKNIAAKVIGNRDLLLEALFIEDPDIVGHLSLVDRFIKMIAVPYGKTDNVARKFWQFNQEVERFHEKSRKSHEGSSRKPAVSSSESSLKTLPKVIEEKVSLSETTDIDKALPGNLTEPSLRDKGVEDDESGINIRSEKMSQEDADLPRAPAVGGWRIDKGYEGLKFSSKRFGYDILSITLLKCGFPKALLKAEVGKKNDYRSSEYVVTIHHAVVSIALYRRDQWKHMFEYQKKRNLINTMPEVEKYLPEMEFLKEFQMTDDLDKIRRSLAFYSELILFLHYNNLEIDFEKFLDVWSRYFDEKVAVKEDPDVLLEALLIEDPDISINLRLLNFFIQKFAIPYGRINVSRQLGSFYAEVYSFFRGSENRLAEILGPSLPSVLNSTEYAIVYAPSEDIEEPVLLSNPTSPEPLKQPLPLSLPYARTTGVESEFERMNIGSDETTKGELEHEVLPSKSDSPEPHDASLPPTRTMGVESEFEKMNIGSDETTKDELEHEVLPSKSDSPEPLEYPHVVSLPPAKSIQEEYMESEVMFEEMNIGNDEATKQSKDESPKSSTQ